MIGKIVLSAVVSLMGVQVVAEQTTGEKASATANDAKRSVKKKIHRAEESVCAKGDTQCLADKAKHRTQEGSDYTKDKVKELKDKAD